MKYASCPIYAIIIAIALGISGLARATAIGDFENISLDSSFPLDGWGSDGGEGSQNFPPALTPTLYAQSIIGATLHSHSLQATQGSDEFWGPSTGNLATEGFLGAFSSASKLSYDLTMISADMFTGDNSASGNFAQSPEIAIEMKWNAGGTLASSGDVGSIKDKLTGGATDSLMPNAPIVGEWNGVDGTRTITWDLTKFKLTDPSTNTSVTYAQFIAAHPAQISDLRIDFSVQIGDVSVNGDQAPGSMFFDNVQLLVPEPASIGLLGFWSVLCQRRRK